MPWPRRHGRLIGSFIDVEDGQSEGSVPYVNSEASDSEHTEEELATLNGGWGIEGELLWVLEEAMRQ